jgi:hypothetical protein
MQEKELSRELEKKKHPIVLLKNVKDDKCHLLMTHNSEQRALQFFQCLTYKSCEKTSSECMEKS